MNRDEGSIDVVEEFKSRVADKLVAARGPRNQRNFAHRIGTAQQTLSKYETGDIPRNWFFLARLHDEEGVDLNALLTTKDGNPQ